MERGEAEAVLGVPPGSDPAAVRSAYRRLIRARHPDRAGDDHTAAAARIIEAYQVLRRSGTTPGPPDPGPTGSGRVAPAPAGTDRVVTDVRVRHDGDPPRRGRVGLDGDTAILSLAPEDALRRLLDALHDLGEVTYVDLGAGLIEVVVGFQEGPVCLLLVTVERRGDRVEAHLVIDSLDARPAPPIAAVAAVVVDIIERRSGTTPPVT